MGEAALEGGLLAREDVVEDILDVGGGGAQLGVGLLVFEVVEEFGFLDELLVFKALDFGVDLFPDALLHVAPALVVDARDGDVDPRRGGPELA